MSEKVIVNILYIIADCTYRQRHTLDNQSAGDN